MKLVPAAIVLCACRPPAAPAPPPDPLWGAAIFVAGDGGEHLPAPARALVALDETRALAALDGGGLAEIDLARGESARAVRGAIDGEIAAMARLRDGRVIAVGSGSDRERAWWIDPRELTARAIDVAGASGGDSVHDATGVAVSPDGRALVITGVRLPLALRDPRDLAITRIVSPERNWGNPVFVDDSYLIAFHHGTVVPFDLGTGHMAIDRPWDSSIGFTSPDGLALMHPPDRVGLELTDLHDPKYKIALSSADPVDVAWSPDGQHVVVIDSDRVVAYDVPEGGGHPIALPGTWSRAVFGRGGAHLVITAAGALWRVDPATGGATGPKGPNLGAIAFVAPGGDGVLAMSDRWRELGVRGVGASGAWRGRGGPAFAVSPDGGTIAASSIANGEAFVEAWNARTGAPRLSALVDGGVVALEASDDGTIEIATPDGIAAFDPTGADHVIASARWAAPVDLARGVAAYARAGAIAIVDLRTPDHALVSLAAFDCDAAATVRLARDGEHVAIVDGDRVAIADVLGRDTPITARLPGLVRAIAIDGERVYVATDDRLIVWIPHAGLAEAINLPARVTAIGAAGDRIALGFADGRAGLWTRSALAGLASPTALVAAGPLPPRCPGDPLAPADDAASPRIQRLPSP